MSRGFGKKVSRRFKLSLDFRTGNKDGTSRLSMKSSRAIVRAVGATVAEPKVRLSSKLAVVKAATGERKLVGQKLKGRLI